MLRAAAVKVLGAAVPDESEFVYELLEGPGVLVEVGAHVGDEVFLQFARDGWEIHAFEPDRSNRAALERRTSRFANVTVRAEAVSDAPGTATLFASGESSGISSLSPFVASHEAAGEVAVTSLEAYIRDLGGPERIDFLKVDVEGFERFVLAGVPWETHRPRAIMLEFEDRKTARLGYGWTDLAEDLCSHGYDVLVSEWCPITRYGANHRWRRFARYPTTLADAKAWGNLIAVEPCDFDRLCRVANARARKLRRRARVDAIRERVAT